MQFFLVLIDSCYSAVICVTINLQVFPGFCQILDARAVHWWACVQMLDTGVWFGKCSKSSDNPTRTICRYMCLSCRVWLSHACFFHCKMPYIIFQSIFRVTGNFGLCVMHLNPSLKRLRFQKRKTKQNKRGEKSQDSSQSNSELLFKLPSWLVCALGQK